MRTHTLRRFNFFVILWNQRRASGTALRPATNPYKAGFSTGAVGDAAAVLERGILGSITPWTFLETTGK